MARLIKRYGSRKLYDTQESRYVSLDDVATWVREGQEIKVLDNATQEDATVATLTQVISEEGRKGDAFLPSDLLHNLIRVGGQAVTSRVRKFQSGVDRLMKSSIENLVPVSGVREEMNLLRQRLDELENALSQTENTQEKTPEVAPEVAEKKVTKTTTTRKRKPAASKTSTTKTTRTRTTAAKKTAAKKPVAKTTTPKKTATARKTVKENKQGVAS